mgnify:CR=1 FL=1|tara:strand:- start:2702 stop:3442 length:741 start_codon:yes stop_codon:yes gene_type:complete
MSEEVPAKATETSNEASSDFEGNSAQKVSEENDLERKEERLNSSSPDSSEEKLDESILDSQSTPPDNEARLLQLEKEHETLRSQYMRIAADFDNFRKRQSRDNDDLRLQLTCTTLSEILPIVDNFERARKQLEPQGDEAKALHRSYQGLYKQLVDVLKQLGVAPMRVLDQHFDPTLHEAVLREPSESKEEDVIIEELQRGYHLNGRVLRHAMVKVSMGPGPNSLDKKQSKVEQAISEESGSSQIEN